MISKFASPICVTTNVISSTLPVNGEIIKSIFPLPAKNKLTILFNKFLSGGRLVLIDLSGRYVFGRAIDQGNSISLDISELPSGIYFLKVNSDENCSIKKIVKQ